MAPLILHLGTRYRWVVSFTPCPPCPLGKCHLFPLNKRRDGPQSRFLLFGKQKNLFPESLSGPSSILFCGYRSFCRRSEAAWAWISPLTFIWCRTEITVTVCNNYRYFDFLLTYLLSSEQLLRLTWLRRQQALLKRPHTLTRPNGFTTHQRFLFHSILCGNRHQHNYVPTEYRGTQSLDPQSKKFPIFMKPEGPLRPLPHFRPKRAHSTTTK